MRVIVVGAGLAGLTAMHELCKKGFEVIALEKNERAGGRMYCVRDQGYTMDAGAQWMLSGYDTLFRLIEETGLGDDIMKMPLRGARILSGDKVYRFGMSPDPRVLSGHIGYLRSTFNIKNMHELLRFSAHLINRWKDLTSITDHDLWDLDSESFADFALRKSSPEVFDNILQPAVSSPIFSDPEKIGAAMGVLCISKLALSIFRGLIIMKNCLGGISERLQEMYSGNIRLSTAAGKIVIERGAVKGVDTKEGFIDADVVVCATTASKALEMIPGLSGATKGALGEAACSACCHVMLAVDNKPFRKGEYGVIFPRTSGSPIAVLTSSRSMAGYTVPQGDLVHCFTYGRYSREMNAMTDAEIIRTVKSEIRRRVPKVLDRVRFFNIQRFDEAVFLSPPGTLRTLKRAGEDCHKYTRGLYLAGEYLGVGCLEAAARSGLDAAARVARNYT